MSLDFAQRPLLVFWETTRAGGLACQHCRASAIPHPLPGELSTAEGRDLIRQVAAFGRPRPILVLTGGDCLARPDIFERAAHAAGLGIHVAMSPSRTRWLLPQLGEAAAIPSRGAQPPAGCAYSFHARRVGHRLHRSRWRRLPGRLPAASPRQRTAAAAGRAVSRQQTPEGHPRRRLQWALRFLRVPPALWRIARARLRERGRSNGGGSRLLLPARPGGGRLTASAPRPRSYTDRHRIRTVGGDSPPCLNPIGSVRYL